MFSPSVRNKLGLSWGNIYFSFFMFILSTTFKMSFICLYRIYMKFILVSYDGMQESWKWFGKVGMVYYWLSLPASFRCCDDTLEDKVEISSQPLARSQSKTWKQKKIDRIFIKIIYILSPNTLIVFSQSITITQTPVTILIQYTFLSLNFLFVINNYFLI